MERKRERRGGKVRKGLRVRRGGMGANEGVVGELGKGERRLETKEQITMELRKAWQRSTFKDEKGWGVMIMKG